jgi:hypothetical protein
MPRRDDEFYVGYEPRSPGGIASRSRAAVVIALAVAIAIAIIVVAGQGRFDTGTFEFGVDRVVDGIVVERPYPLLLVPGDDGLVTHTLVAFGKHGAGELVAGMDSTPVRVAGSLIYNDRERMIEAHAVEPLEGEAAERLKRLGRAGEVELGTLTLVGEIVDSKCHLGVMKPGRGKAHKACAIRCIAGGVPPVLRVEDRDDRVAYLLLVSAEGDPVNEQVLDLVAEPVEITGRVTRAGDRLVLYADPSTYRRVGR